MTPDNGTGSVPDSGVRRLLLADAFPSATHVDVAIILLLLVFLFSATLSIAVMSIAYGAAAILWIGRMVWKRHASIPKTPLDTFFLAYVVVEGLATLGAYNREQSLLYMYRRVTLIPIIYIVLGNIHSPRMVKMFVGALITSLLAVALYSARDVLIHAHEYLLFERRLSEFQMYMTGGGMMMMGMLLLLPFVVHRRTPTRVRWLAIAAFVPIGADLLFTFTRSSWLGFLAGAIVVGAIRAKKVFLPLVLIVLTVFMLSSPEMKERMSSSFNPYHPNNITRLHMWETGIKIVKDHPILGVGDIGIEQVWPFYAPPDWEPAGHLHNNLIMWLVTIGIVGFVVLVSLFVKIWLVMSRIERRLHDDWLLGSVALGGLAVLAGFHVNGLFEWNFGDAEIIAVVWAVVGMTLAADKVAQRKENLV